MNSGEPLITTIIPTYRRPRLLRRAIKSVLAQTYPNFRLCIYDNASGDETSEIVAELAEADPRISYHCHSENFGAVYNFTYGMRQVETPFFSFLSDDDVLLPNFYEVALKGFAKYPKARFSATGTLMMDKNGYVLANPILHWQPGYFVPPDGFLAMCRNSHPIWTGVLYRQEVIDLLQVSPELFDDKYLNLKIASRYPFVITHEPGAILIVDSSTFSQANRFNLFVVPIIEYFILHMIQDEQLDQNVRNICKNILTKEVLKTALLAGLAAIVRGDYAKAEPAYNVLQKYCLTDPKALIYFLALKCCRYIPLARHPLHLFHRIRSKLIKHRNRYLQHSYGQFKDYLQC